MVVLFNCYRKQKRNKRLNYVGKPKENIEENNKEVKKRKKTSKNESINTEPKFTERTMPSFDVQNWALANATPTRLDYWTFSIGRPDIRD